MNIAKIAELSGVSKATVSRVINGNERVNPEIRKKVLEIIRKVGFVPNRNARYLAGISMKTIGVILCEIRNFFYMEIAEGIDDVLSEKGYSMQMCFTYWEREKELAYIKSLISNHVDGVIVTAIDNDSEGLRLLKETGTPFVVINSIPADPSIPFVTGDNFRGGQLIGEKIRTSGYHELVIIQSFDDNAMHERVRGILSEIDIPYETVMLPAHPSQEEEERLRSLILRKAGLARGPIALFVSNDSMAIAVENLIYGSVRIPEQVSIFGYDNIELSSYCRVPLTTVRQNMYEMGKTASRMLLESKEWQGDDERHVFIAPELIERESSI